MDVAKWMPTKEKGRRFARKNSLVGNGFSRWGTGDYKFLPLFHQFPLMDTKWNFQLGPVVRKPNNTIHGIVIFSTVVKLFMDCYNSEEG